MKKKYKVIVSCGDCTGEDPMGCFDGGTETEFFDTLREAIEYGEGITRVGIWEYEILRNGEEVADWVFNREWRKFMSIIK